MLESAAQENFIVQAKKINSECTYLQQWNQTTFKAPEQ